jgi:hypothetical protein
MEAVSRDILDFASRCSRCFEPLAVTGELWGVVRSDGSGALRHRKAALVAVPDVRLLRLGLPAACHCFSRSYSRMVTRDLAAPGG